MSGLSETELHDKFKQSVKEARDACMWLGRNANPESKAPRGHYYRVLKTACHEAEGVCRQFAAYRADTRWLPHGIRFAKVALLAHRYRVEEEWLAFFDLAKFFDNEMERMEDLLTRRVNRIGIILPKQTGWLQMPEYRTPRPPVRGIG